MNPELVVSEASTCEVLVSPLPSPCPKPLAIANVAGERRVIMVDSRKPNSKAILERAKERLEERGVAVEAVRDKQRITVVEADETHDGWAAEGRPLFVLGVFD